MSDLTQVTTDAKLEPDGSIMYRYKVTYGNDWRDDDPILEGYQAAHKRAHDLAQMSADEFVIIWNEDLQVWDTILFQGEWFTP